MASAIRGAASLPAPSVICGAGLAGGESDEDRAAERAAEPLEYSAPPNSGASVLRVRVGVLEEAAGALEGAEAVDDVAVPE